MLTFLFEIIAQTITASPDMAIGILTNKYAVSIHHEKEIVIFSLLHGVDFLIYQFRCKGFHHHLLWEGDILHFLQNGYHVQHDNHEPMSSQRA